ncbi:MAG: type I-MYXAN CRISPR-associated protein Cas5/Cmx5/DevS [Gemmata sp.]
MLWLRIEAPFATFRTFTAGWYRPTATFLTPSAAYGLVMNLAGIETRLREGADGHDGKMPASLTAKDLPAVKLAMGAAGEDRRGETISFDEAFPRVQTTYQQLHNYPVGTSGQERAESCRGNKYNITPVRREFLSDLRAVIGVDADGAVLDRVRRGLTGEFPRYGVPFLGDNNFLLDRAELLDAPKPAYWFVPVTESGSGPRPRTARLTIAIDRADLSRTTSQLFAPVEGATVDVPKSAWTPFKGS